MKVLDCEQLKCEKKFFTTGIISSPNYPGKYPNNLEKTQTIQVKKDLVVSLEFTAFNVESSPTCRYDHLTILDGDGTVLMEKTCGTSLPNSITSRTNTMKLLFHTDRGGARAGWSARWRAATPQGLNDIFYLSLCNN